VTVKKQSGSLWIGLKRGEKKPSLSNGGELEKQKYKKNIGRGSRRKKRTPKSQLKLRRAQKMGGEAGKKKIGSSGPPGLDPILLYP